MDGPSHYQEAEQLLSRAVSAERGDSYDARMLLTAWAGVHATLALAAATALNDAKAGLVGTDDFDAWCQAASVAAPIPPETADGEVSA